MNDNQKIPSLKNEDNEENEIDLIKIYGIIIRNKFFIINLSVLILLISCIFSLLKKRVWEGQFEIVIGQKQNNPVSNNSLFQSALNSNLLNNFNSQTLNTEVGILKSPSVLMPIFNYVNSEKSNQNATYKKIDFTTWENKNLNIGLKKRTAILNITYRDKDKAIIIPVLKKISLAYQNYSGQQKNRNFDLTKSYLETQIALYRKKSSLSKKVALEYANEQNLSLNDIETNYTSFTGKALENFSFRSMVGNLPINTFNSNDQGITNKNSLESIRLNAINEINRINFQISKIKNLTDVKELQYMGSTINALVEQGLPMALEEIEAELIDLRSKYKDSDISVIKLLEKREIYAKLLKERALGYLKAKKISYEAKLESVKRPKGVLIKGKELMRESKRDEKTLVNLEDNLRNLELLQSRQEDPWKLITQPTIKEFPVAPNRRKIAFIGLLSGFIISSALAYFKERFSGLIFEEKDLENLFSMPILTRVNLEENLVENSSAQLKLNELRKLSLKKITFIFLSSEKDKENFKLNNLNIYLSKIFTNKMKLLSSSEDLIKEDSDNAYILITSLGKLKCNDAKSFKSRAQFLQINFEGIILITDNKV